MTTLAATCDAVTALLLPLVADGTLKRVRTGIAEQTEEFPAAEVRFGLASFTRDHDALGLERYRVRNGAVRLYVNRGMRLDDAVRALIPLIDAVDAAFRADPRLGGLADRFDMTGHGGPPAMDEEIGALFVDVGWTAEERDPDTYVQDW
ncbi:MAG TPA: hypothetical protein VH475_22185 [Tepidisphaeraceae bacterium]|jgi:hypothetical protein